MEDKASEFLKRLGMKDKEQEAKPSQWDQVIQPKSTYLLTGDVGTGKSGLAYALLETYGTKYGLTPTVVGVPRDKRNLLPDYFACLSSIDDIASRENAIIFLDEADIQLPLDGKKDKETVINFLSLPRQRKQIFILAYHYPRLVKGTYMPFFSGFLFKRPPYLIEFATKQGSAEMLKMMGKAGERFNELPVTPEEQASAAAQGEQPLTIKQHTYVVAPKIRWQGMLENALATFWTQELSEVWSGTATSQPGPTQLQLEETTAERLNREIGALFPAGVTAEILDTLIEMDKNYDLEELKQRCAERGLSAYGHKKLLAARLVAKEMQNG